MIGQDIRPMIEPTIAELSAFASNRGRVWDGLRIHCNPFVHVNGRIEVRNEFGAGACGAHSQATLLARTYEGNTSE